MTFTTDLPDGLLAVPYGKGCTLLFTPEKITRAIKRGKWWKRRQALLQRETAKESHADVSV